MRAFLPAKRPPEDLLLSDFTQYLLYFDTHILMLDSKFFPRNDSHFPDRAKKSLAVDERLDSDTGSSLNELVDGDETLFAEEIELNVC